MAKERGMLSESDRLALEGLVNRSCYTREKLQIVQEAVTAARDPYRALGFAVALMQLLKDHVPVGETVRWALEFERTVSLGWTAARWRAEHRKLSKAPILWRLASSPAASRAFACDWLNRCVPLDSARERRVHVVNSPRRIGVVGFRLGYCLAGYEPSCREGLAGAVSVLLEGKRWVVILAAPTEASANCPTVQRIHGVGGAEPNESERTVVLRSLVGVREAPVTDAHPTNWQVVVTGIVTAVATAAALIEAFPVYYLMPTPDFSLFAVGAGMLGVRKATRRWRALTNLILAVLWGVPAALVLVACLTAGPFSIQPYLVSTAALMPAGYAAAAVTWWAARRLAAAVRGMFGALGLCRSVP